MNRLADYRLHSRALAALFATLVVAGCSTNQGSSTSAAGASGTNASNPANASTAALVELSSTEYAAVPAGSAVVTINRTGLGTGAATVGYTTVNGTAIAGTDYVAMTGSVTWQDGETGPKTVSIPTAASGNGKSFAFSLTSVSGAVDFGSPASATVGISATANANGTVTLSWAAPVENTNGSTLVNLAGYDIYYGASATDLPHRIAVSGVGIQSYVVDGLSAGTWYFEVAAVNSAGVSSVPSGVVSTTIS